MKDNRIWGGPDGRYDSFIRSLPCSVPGCEISPIHAHHVKTRGAGGTAKDLVPLCYVHHAEWHTIGRYTFDRKRGTKLEEYAGKLWAGY